jgi:transposase
MIGLPSTLRIFFITEPTDMRKGFDSLSAIVQRYKHDPFSGHLFVFCSKRRNRIKILYWHKGGYILWYKRLEKGHFKLPYSAIQNKEVYLDTTQLTMLLEGIDFSKIRRPKLWTPKRHLDKRKEYGSHNLYEHT